LIISPCEHFKRLLVGQRRILPSSVFIDTRD
jgi:hypothetical protein